MFIPHYWKVLLDGYGEGETGDALIKDGEDDYLFFDPFLGLLCHSIAEWHAEKEAARVAAFLKADNP